MYKKTIMKEIRKGTEFDEDMKNKKDGVREREVEIKGWSERKGGTMPEPNHFYPLRSTHTAVEQPGPHTTQTAVSSQGPTQLFRTIQNCLQNYTGPVTLGKAFGNRRMHASFTR